MIEMVQYLEMCHRVGAVAAIDRRHCIRRKPELSWVTIVNTLVTIAPNGIAPGNYTLMLESYDDNSLSKIDA